MVRTGSRVLLVLYYRLTIQAHLDIIDNQYKQLKSKNYGKV
nr:MAG TPA: hypothetical protein [Caudoviricetes sp.]